MERTIILVTGLSGAGKTTAMGVLEEMGYYCIDRFPVDLIQSFCNLLNERADNRYQHLALSVSAGDFQQFYLLLQDVEANLRILYLDAADDQLLLRYKHSRRKHPLLLSNRANTLEEAIDVEREDLTAIRDVATVSIDTTFLNQQALRNKIQQIFSSRGKSEFSISFISFGYRYGLPQDADLVFDVRHLANPFWQPPLRSKSGEDKEVYDFVIGDEQTQSYIQRLQTFLDYSFVQQEKEGKNHVTVAIGCTGGQHRSVSVVNWLVAHYQSPYVCFKNHRDSDHWK